ncbi:MAG: 4Fe-4S dicluster domain-containing protein [Nitrospirae bacterium]|nr:4Fe-4S dicluster domain-containing protein [Nitrospirota bacterium]
MNTVSKIERREFLKIGFLITGVFAGGTVLSLASNIRGAFASTGEFTEKYPYKPHYSMLIRQNLCVDCERCIEACTKTNEVPSYGYRTIILEKVVPDAIGQKREFIPVLCNQCNNPPCVRVCPTRASYKDKNNGIVMIERKKCIGCKACVLACPYNARYFNEEVHAIDKCDFCFDTRLSKGEKLTGCAAACPTGARKFGDISDPNDFVYQMIHQIEKQVWVMRPEAGTKPNVFYMKA